ncbi:hypothetical protein MXD62_20095 [Frankia sp. Mgl5]|uniref:hypothetical protein n=1 Tax=Frankia sp. Mgl5 TaxID=2933793 RepID=UPI00200CE27A|nr:hypothetical protein [Frankia sp. Mgl5]MCK9929453.1 hypothetical protein [Frankia sp. Mgl5]
MADPSITITIDTADLARAVADELDRRAGQLLGWAITFRTDYGGVVLDDTDLCGTVAEATALATSRDLDQFGDGPGRRGIAALRAQAAKQAADGLDDADGPVTRAALYAAHTPWPFIAVWAADGDRWWQVAYDGDADGIGWTEVPAPDATLRRLPGWVEIPQATPAASEEPADTPGSDHDIEIVRSADGRWHWSCGICAWVGADIGTEKAARAEHAKIAADIASGKLRPAETSEDSER